MKQRLLALLLALALLVSVLPQTALSVFAETLGGQCGERLNWTLDPDSGELVISGTGAMYDWTAPENVPWYAYRAQIRSVVLPQGLTGIGSYAFADCTQLSSVTIPDGAGFAGSYGSTEQSSAQLPKRGAAGVMPSADGPVTVTAGMLVANAYEGLSAAEQALLRSEYVIGQSYTYTVPTAEEDLITVEPEIRRITAKPYTDRGFTWQPASATVVYDGGTEPVVLTDGKGEFAYEGNAYHAQVEYALDVVVDETVQSKLLNGPYRLARGLANLDDFYMADGSLTAIASNIMPLKQLADGIKIGGGITITLKDQQTKEAIWRLCAQVTQYGKFDISRTVDEYYDVLYSDSQSSVKYLLTKGAAFRTTAVQAYADLKQIALDEGIDNLMSFMEDADARKARVAILSMQSIVQDLEEAATDDWAVLANNPLKSGLSNDDYLALDEMASAVDPTQPHGDPVISPIRAAKTTIENNVNQHNVTVTVSASRIAPATVDSTQLTALETHSRTLHLSDGTTRTELLQAIMKSGIESGALAAWVVITADNYDRSVSELPATLTEDITYSIDYRPRSCAITTDFGLTPTVVPYGYNLTLPLHGGSDFVYDYELNGQSYREGTVYTVRGDVTVRRLENKPWEVLRINTLVSECYASELTAQERAVLTAQALDSDVLLLRRPGEKDALIKLAFLENGCKVTAQSYPSGVQGLTWQPDSGKAFSSAGTELATFAFTGNEATVAADNVSRVEVAYRLTITTVSPERVLHLLRLPALLAEEAREQKRILEIPNSMYADLSGLDKPMLNKVNLAVKGSDMTDKSKAAVQRILDVCVDEANAKLYVYSFLTDYRKNGLVQLYRDDNYLMLQAQIQVLNENLSQIYHDPGFLPLLQDVGYEDKYEDIGKVIDKLEQTYLQTPNAAILLSNPALPALVTALEAAQGHTAEHNSPDKPLQITETVTASAPTEAAVHLTVRLCGSSGAELGAQTQTVMLPLLQPLTAANLAALQTKLTELTAKLGVDTAHYETHDVLTLKAGDRLRADAAVELVYVPKQYAVRFVEDGTELSSASFPYDLPVITLAPTQDNSLLYIYTVLGTQILVGSEEKTYTLSSGQIDSLGSEPLAVSRRKVSAAQYNAVGVGPDAFSGCSGLTRLTVLDPRCVIADTATTLGGAQTTVIYGYAGSTAQTYAQKYGYRFVALTTATDAPGCLGVYDGESHTARISVTGPMSFTIWYSTTAALSAANYSTAGTLVPPARIKAGVTTVFYYVKDATGRYGDSAGKTEIVIQPKVEAAEWSGIYDGEAHSATVQAQGGAKLYYSTQTALDYENYNSAGSTTAPSRTEEGTTTVYYIAVPETDASETSCVSGQTRIDVQGHLHSDTYRLNVAPTRSSDGSVSCSCEICHRTETIPLPALNETDYDYTVLNDPSCTGEGTGRYTWKTITYGVYSFDDPIPALGHSFVNGICTRCGRKQETLLYKTELENAIAAAGQIDRTLYTDESVNALDTAIEEARQALTEATAQAELDAAEMALYAAIRALVPKTPRLDKTGLQAAIAAAEKVRREDYTDESVLLMDTILTGARRILNEATLQSELDYAEAELDAAVMALVRKPDIPLPPLDRTALRAAVSTAERINKKAYTLESLAALETALADAKLALSGATVQAELDKAEAVLTAALHALQPLFEFDDVKDPGKFFYEPVYWAYNHTPQITNGATATTFSPNNPCTRGHVVTFLWRAAGEPAPKGSNNPFTDLKETAFYYKAVLWAVGEGITNGKTEKTFAPNLTCTRGEIVTFLWRYKKSVEPTRTDNPFTDVKEKSFYYKAVLWAVENDVTNGMTATTFAPGRVCTRGQVVTFLYRASE